MGILLALCLIFISCLIIWRACDGFEFASEYIGRNMSEGVRGGTINAISSSLPELFTTMIALFLISGQAGTGNEEAFSVGIGTTAGSALFNGMIIPAVCILSVVGTVILGVKVTSVNVSTKVLLRDGLFLIGAELVLILLLNGTKLYWWHGLLLMVMYIVYFAYMLLSMKAAGASDDEEDDDEEEDDDDVARGPIAVVFYWMSFGPLLDLESFFVNDETEEKIKNETWNGWPLLLASATVIGVACWLLVMGCEWLGSGPEHPYELFGMTLPTGLNMPIMFVAVIFASMATSVPDTVISFRDARDGDYDDAVANALGSNIFDICFALGFPLFLYTLVFQKPIEMGETVAAQSAELRFILLILTVLGFLTYYIGKRVKNDDGVTTVAMGRGKAVILLALYALFVVYIVGLSQKATWATGLSETVRVQILGHDANTNASAPTPPGDQANGNDDTDQTAPSTKPAEENQPTEQTQPAESADPPDSSDTNDQPGPDENSSPAK
ncbi:MAG: sodium:calcium antiporter [Planctomycetota bacterium]